MSNRKSIIFLVVVSLAAIVVNALIAMRPPSSVEIKRTTLIDGGDFAPCKLTLRRGGETVARLEKSDVWRLVEPRLGEADARVVIKLVDLLESTAIVDAVSLPELRRLGHEPEDFFNSERRFLIEMEDGEGERMTIELGERNAAGDGIYAMLSGMNAVLVLPVGLESVTELVADRFRIRDIFPFAPETVIGFDIRRPGEGSIDFVREGDGWKVGGAKSSSSAVNELLSLIASTEATSFVWPTGDTADERGITSSLLSSYGLDSESAVILTMRCIDGAERRIALGGRTGDESVYALVDNGGSIVTLGEALKRIASEPTSHFVESRLFPIDLALVNSFSLMDGDLSYLIARSSDDGWRLDSPVVAQADDKTVTTILGRILALSRNDVAETGLMVGVNTNGETAVVSKTELLGDVRLEDLRAREILRIDPALVRRIVSTSGGRNPQSVSVVHSRERREWSVEASAKDAVASEDGIKDVLDAACRLRAESIVSLKATATELARYGLEKPFHVIAIDQEQESSLRRNILIGDETRGGRYATIGSMDAIFVISDSTVSKLLAELVE